MTALVCSILGPCIPRVICVVMLPRRTGLILTRQPGTPLAQHWPKWLGSPCSCAGGLSDRNILVDPDTLAVTGFLDWEMANIMPAYFEYVQARLSGAHRPEWRKELLDVLRSVLCCECGAGQEDLDAVNDDGEERYRRTLAAWDAVAGVERIAQGYDDSCYWTFETGLPDGSF